MKHVLVALTFLALPLSGCLSSPVTPASDGTVAFAGLSPPRFDGVIAEHAPLRAPDGVTIDARVFRPDVGDSDEKVPVIINFSPYWSNLAPPAETGGDAFSQYLIEYFVPRGYAVALVSARGTGLSEGCFSIGGPAEVDDEDLAATYFGEAAWSNGNVTATGKSYDGTMAQGLITRGNPHVKTIIPVSPISELYKYNLKGGVQYANGVLINTFNTDYVIGTSLSQGASTYKPGAPSPSDPTYQKMPTRMCRESADVQTAQYDSVVTGTYSPYWQARNYTALLPETLDTSVFYIHGLSDWNVKTDHMDPWIEALHARGVPLKMWLGQWTHEYPTRDDWNVTMLRWMDHFLKGIDTGILDEPLVQVQDDTGVWRDEAAWPPARTERRILFTGADGKLGDVAGSGTFTYADAPDAPFIAGSRMRFELAMPEGGRLVGTPIVFATVSATGPRATLSATLFVDDRIVNEGFLDLTHRDGLATSAPLTPGTKYEVALQMFPQDVVVPAGSVVRLALGHDSHGPSGAMPWPTTAQVTIHHNSGTGIMLPLLALSDIVPEARQPDDVGCWAC